MISRVAVNVCTEAYTQSISFGSANKAILDKLLLEVNKEKPDPKALLDFFVAAKAEVDRMSDLVPDGLLEEDYSQITSTMTGVEPTGIAELDNLRKEARNIQAMNEAPECMVAYKKATEILLNSKYEKEFCKVLGFAT